ncbi:EAL domain-containing protein [Rhodoferax sp. AJA081-3]|uniref:sensor domain-containing protein n=1 Tax=Rhodoferax sp. AJA081-3 TaxID=2752316 RepID=UPI001AE0BC1F|nr:bifunctional diguanylate cyclase/phosphodiesterase [Rhodoferax sp. AJA081-3]QTN27868.1 EAL domain-containing protein [Rhodoferax sp. AJA081-3]
MNPDPTTLSPSHAALLARAVEQSPLGIIVVDRAGQVQYSNPGFTALSGFSPAEVIGITPHPWNPDEATTAIYSKLLNSQHTSDSWKGDVQSTHKDGNVYWERQVVSTLRDAQGQPTHLVVVKEDVSDRKLRRADYAQTRHLHEKALASSSNGIMITRSDADDHSIVYVNPAFERITGYSAEEVIGLEGRFLVRDDLAQPDLEHIRSALRERREGSATLRNYRKDGSLFWNELHIAPVHDLAGGTTTHFVSVINDISERVRYQHALEYQANHDSLTGLANRNLLNDRIEQAIAWAKRNGHVLGVMLLDLDHFKLINDASGHSAGDALLKEVAQRLTACVRETDTVARLGGDEFVIILTDLPQPDDVDQIAEKILSTLSRPAEVAGRDVFVTASIGVSLYPRDGDHGEILLRYADMAMYRVKEHGRNSVRQFVPEMGSTAISRLDMEGAMRRGLERGEFVLHYQPKIDLATQAVVGAEALIRWQHPQIGLIHPIEFIRLAEETGLILPLGEWVLAEACRQQVLWRQQSVTPLRISINMSARQFRQDELTDRIAAVFASTGADPSQFIVELTESMVMHDVDSTLASLRALKKLGLSLSLDDFGTGYSSLSYLRRFPIDELKIDRSFINDIHTNPDDAAIAGAIIAMARSLGLSVVAEGVENKEQAELLSTLGCSQVQGYYYARPLTVAAFTARLREQQTHQA